MRDLRKNLVLYVLKHHTSSVHCVSISNDELQVLSGSSDCTAILWSLLRGTIFYILTDHLGPVTACDFSPDGVSIVTGSTDQTVRVYKRATGECTSVIQVSAGLVTAVLFAMLGGSHVIVGTSQGLVRMYDYGKKKARAVSEIAVCVEAVNTIVRGSTIDEIIVGDCKGGVTVYDITHQKWLYSFHKHDTAVYSIALWLPPERAKGRVISPFSSQRFLFSQ